MIATKFRLGHNEIDFILKKGCQLETGKFIVKYAKTVESFSRYCVIISRKFYKKAVDRNRLKRKIHTGLSKMMDINTQNLNIVLIPKKSLSEKTEVKVIEQDLEKIFNTLNKQNG
ncbi:MAG: ribonuclease P protein component [Candidatus Gracilibacteria bacterium]|jgi:ribonuclease P protein component